MSGLLALLDDVAAIAKLAAAQLDDVAAQATKAGSKVVGVVIDDAAVTPKYVSGLPAARELPIVWKIARASFFNKLVILLPAALLLDLFAPWLVTPLLMLGGAYLCFEGAEKVRSLFVPHEKSAAQKATAVDAAHLEEQRVRGAIQTDFILSAEIMTIALATIDADTLAMQAAVLAAVAVGITALVYGAVAILVKADDVGLRMSLEGRTEMMRGLGRGIVRAMPSVMTGVATIGTAAMLWVGGSIVVHGLRDLGWRSVYDGVKGVAESVATSTGLGGFGQWMTTATLDGFFGLALGLLLIPLVHRLIMPLIGRAH